MRFAYRLIESFPPLAWVAISDPGDETITIRHGCFVERHPHFFIEGAWAGDFAEGRIHDSDTVFGSGGVVADGAVTFVSCTATTDFLYYVEKSELCAVSNSLPLLLALVEDELIPACVDYSHINMSVLNGIRNYRPEIPTLKGHVSRVLHHNILLGRNGITLVEKPLPPGFRMYGEYRDFMRSRIKALFSNARHPARHMPMQIFSTQSKGYDSTAVNALAAPFGIDKVFTSPQSKEHRSFHMGKQMSQPSDDGTPICEVLGLACVRIDRLSFKDSLVSEHYYWAGLDNNQDFNLHQIHEFINVPTLLLTGNLGEIWYTSEAIGKARLATFNDELIRWDQAGFGLGEVRLTAGVVQVAVPFIGARRRRDILAITDDATMDAYRLGGAYDRPIPRRIAEEAGVPREMFGQIKLASIVHFPSPNVPVTPALRADFFRHLREKRLLGFMGILFLPVVQLLNNWIYWNNPSRYFNNRRRYPFMWYLGYGWSKLTGQPLRISMVWTRLDSYLYAYCVNKVREEYAEHLSRMHPIDTLSDVNKPATAVNEMLERER